MRILITGGAGFLGSLLADHLLLAGHEVFVIDNLATGSPANLRKQEKLTVVMGTIADKTLVRECFSNFKPTHLIHAAASYKDPANWEEDIQTNVLGTINLMKASQLHKVKRVIYLQTALCYGPAKERPISINHPLNPITSYSISKTTGEQFIMLSGLPYISFRLANIYGPRHYSGPIPTFYKRLKNEDKCIVTDTRRDFMDVTDFIPLMNKALMDDGPIGCFNVSTGKDCSIKDLYDLMVKKMGIHISNLVEVIKPQTDDVNDLLLDPSRTEQIFHWKANVKLEDGIERLITWYDKNHVEHTYTHLKIDKK